MVFLNLKAFLGETTFYDKKEKVEKNKPKSWLKSVCAFANSRGGKLIFGVKEDNTVVGLNAFQEDAEFISEMIKTKIDTIPEFDILLEYFDGKVIMILTVFQGRNTPYFYVEGGSRTAYTRIGNQSVVASRMDLLNLSLKGQKLSYDSLPFGKNFIELTFNELKGEYYRRGGRKLEERDFQSFGLVDEKGKLTMAGALFADGLQVYQSRIFCTRWNGLDKTNGLMEALDDVEFEGNLLYLLKATMDFVKRNSKKRWRKSSEKRIDYPDYPERAVQEALVNALIHRDYSIIGSEIHIDLYDDRMEIYSPGGMYDGSFIQNIDVNDIASMRRNPILADLFARMGLMERRGSGLRNIIEAYEFQENYCNAFKPEFRSTETSFFTVLKNLNYKNDVVNDVINDVINDVVNDVLNDAQISEISLRRDKLLVLIKDNRDITIEKMSKTLGVSRPTIERDLSILKKENKVEHVGSPKSGFWKIKQIPK